MFRCVQWSRGGVPALNKPVYSGGIETFFLHQYILPSAIASKITNTHFIIHPTYSYLVQGNRAEDVTLSSKPPGYTIQYTLYNILTIYHHIQTHQHQDQFHNKNKEEIIVG